MAAGAVITTLTKLNSDQRNHQLNNNLWPINNSIFGCVTNIKQINIFIYQLCAPIDVPFQWSLYGAVLVVCVCVCFKQTKPIQVALERASRITTNRGSRLMWTDAEVEEKLINLPASLA